MRKGLIHYRSAQLDSMKLLTFVLCFVLFCQPSRAQDLVKIEKEITGIESELQNIQSTDGDTLQLRKRRIELEEKKAVLEKRHAFISKYPDKGVVVDGFELAKDAFLYALSLHGWSDGDPHNFKLKGAVRREMEGRLVRVEGISVSAGFPEIISKNHQYWETSCSGDPNLVGAKSVAQPRYLDVIFNIVPEHALRERDVAVLSQRTRRDYCWKFEDVKEGIKLPENTVAIEGVVNECGAD